MCGINLGGREHTKSLLGIALAALFIIIVSFCRPIHVQGAEELIFEDIVTVNQSTWSGGEINWQHIIPAEILSEATRVEAALGATDVDYPSCETNCPECTQDNCEHDRLYVNGSEIGLLHGSNNATQANALDIPLTLLQGGANAYRVVNEVVEHDWWLQITQSTIRIYRENSVEEKDDADTGSAPIIEPVSSLKIEKSQSKSTIVPGQTQSYTISVTNTGDTDLTGVRVTDQLDGYLSYTSSRSSMKHSVQDGIHNWTLGTLGAGNKVEIEIQAEVSSELVAGEAISNMAEADANELAQSITSNTVTALSSYIEVDNDDLLVTKRVNRRESRIGRILVYQVTIENRGNGTVFNLVLEDILPNGFSLVSGSVLKDGQKYQDPDGSRRLRWELGSLLAGKQVDIRYQVVIGSTVKRGRNINRAAASAVDGGGNTVEGSDETIVMIGGGEIEVPAEIEALVFLDDNANGLRNSMDEPLEKVTVILSSGEKRVSDKMGSAVFKDILSGFYAIGIDSRTLPEYTRILGDGTQLLRVMEGERVRVLLPVQKEIGPAKLTGVVYRDRNENNSFDDGEQVLTPIKVYLDGTMITRTKEGTYLFAKLESGSHLLEVHHGGFDFREEIELMIGNNEYDIPVPNGGLTLSVEEK